MVATAKTRISRLRSRFMASSQPDEMRGIRATNAPRAHAGYG